MSNPPQSPLQATSRPLQASPLPSPQEFAERLGLPFHNLSLLTRALTHRSYLNENTDALEDNERLEFLGDAVLDFLVAAWLYHRYPEMKEGELTRLRASLVDTNQLAGFARQLGFGPALRMGRGEVENGGRDRTTLLCGAFEAVIGALQLDRGLAAVQAFVHPLLAPAAEEILFRQQDKDAKSLLQELTQGQGQGIPVYTLVETQGPDHARTFIMSVSVGGTVIAHGAGPSKQTASMAAARNALAALNAE